MAQYSDSTHHYIFGVKGHTGFIIPHSTEIINVSNTKPYGFQIDAGRINQSQKAWNKCNCYSNVGLSFAYFNYNDPSILGNSYNLIAFMEPLLSYNPKLNFRFRAGAGLSYLTRIHDATTNPTNLFFGSSISGILLVGFSAHYKVTENWNVNAGVYYNHISNGGQQEPNKGMNFPTASAGVEFNLNTLTITPRDNKAPVDRKIHLFLGAFGNRRTVKSTATEPLAVRWQVGVYSGMIKKFTTTNAWMAGTELSYDASVSEQGRRNGEDTSPILFSILGGHQFCFGRFGFSQQIGHYTYRDYTTDWLFFQRYALVYQVGRRIQTGISLKAHAQEAEQMDVRVGIVL